MGKYKLKSYAVEAIQINQSSNSTEPSFEELLIFFGDANVYCQGEGLRILTQDRSIEANEGDWVVKRGKNYRVLSAEEFEELYEPYDERIDG